MLACPFTLVTNALQGYGHMGAYLGLFNGTICVPQIVAALLGGTILTIVGSNQAYMMIVSGILLVQYAYLESRIISEPFNDDYIILHVVVGLPG